MAEAGGKGVLYVVATPIGNLEDMTYRAVRVLKEAGLIACEDTRQTRKLLDHYGIETPVVSYHEHNESRRAEDLVARLREGTSIAQVSDAGMPGISDPGYRVVKLAIEHGIPVIPVPGSSALTAALAAGGLPTDSFLFLGFLPAKSGQRRTALEALRDAQHTVVAYESPHRIMDSLADIAKILGPDRRVVLARELTKIHEEFLRGVVGEILAGLAGRELKGEITLLIAKAEHRQENPLPRLQERLAQLMMEQKLDERAALKMLAQQQGLSKSELYRELQRERPAHKNKK